MWRYTILLYLLLGMCSACAPSSKEPISVEVSTPRLQISFSSLRLSSQEEERGAIAYHWQEGDTIKLYFKQGESRATLTHILGDNDHFEANRLSRISTIIPMELDPMAPFDLYGSVGACSMDWEKGELIPAFSPQSVPLRTSLEEVARDVLLTFEKKDCIASDQIQVSLLHRGSLVSWGIYAGTATQLHRIKLRNNLGGAEYLFSPSTSGALSLGNAHRERFYAWIPIDPVKADWALSVQLGDNDLYPLSRTIPIVQLERGVHYRISFDTYGDIPYNVALRTQISAGWQKEWMNDLVDETPFFDLLLPGSHDSGANGGTIFTRPWAKCQDLDITQQLEAGVRAFDVRVKADGDDLWIYHGAVYMGGSLRDKIMTPIVNFLSQHPSESVVMLYKKEGGDDAEYQKLSARILADYAPYMCTGVNQSVLRMRDMRGKILLLTRNYVAPLSGRFGFNVIYWGDKETDRRITISPYHGQANPFYAHIQDRYADATSEEKVSFADRLFANSEERYRAGVWSINYLSMTSGLKEVWRVASNINPIFIDKLKGDKTKRRGVVYMDFAGATGVTRGRDLVDAIIENNYNLAD